MQRAITIDEIWRLRFFRVSAFLSVIFLLVFFQLVSLTVFQRPHLSRIADQQRLLHIELQPRRGDFLDRNGRELTTSLKVPSVFVVSREIKPSTALVNKLAKILSLDPTFVKERLARDKAFVWLKRRISEEEGRAIEALKNPSIRLLYESQRFYPHSALGAHIIGFCNIDNTGLEGLELVYDKYLKGEAGYKITERDALGREIAARERKVLPATDGSSVVLTIDLFIQHVLERELDKAYRKWHAKGAFGIIIDPNDGSILAMASRPTFDLNEYKTADTASRRNRAITDFYEPGSVFKIVTASAALSEKVFSVKDRVNCEGGNYNRGCNILHDVHPYGMLSFPEVFIKSSNIGTVKIAEKLGPNIVYDYIKRFGFGGLTGIDLPGEVSGIVRPPKLWSKTSMGAVPIGQEVTVTTLQVVRAMSVIANGGELVHPFIVKEIRDAKSVTLRAARQEPKERVISPEVAATVREILVGVVEEGTGKPARIEGIAIGGKTGTAQKIDPVAKTYSHSNFISSFVGFAPAEKPLFVMMITLDDPHPSYYGATVAAPPFREITREILPYLGYEPPEKAVDKPQVKSHK